MIVDLSTVIKETGNSISVKGYLPFDDVKYLGEDFRFVGKPEIDGTIFNNGKSLTLTGKIAMCLKVNCARCMKEIEREIVIDVEETLIRQEDFNDPDSDAVVFEGTEIDLTDITQSAFFLNVPGKFLCDEDCKGLCPQCGKNLNEGDCGCDNEVIDPRWEALKEIMDRNKN